MKRARFRLFAVPKKPPKWWPMDERGAPRLVGIMAGGAGWVVGAGDSMTEAAIKTTKLCIAETLPASHYYLGKT